MKTLWHDALFCWYRPLHAGNVVAITGWKRSAMMFTYSEAVVDYSIGMTDPILTKENIDPITKQPPSVCTHTTVFPASISFTRNCLGVSSLKRKLVKPVNVTHCTRRLSSILYSRKHGDMTEATVCRDSLSYFPQ